MTASLELGDGSIIEVLVDQADVVVHHVRGSKRCVVTLSPDLAERFALAVAGHAAAARPPQEGSP